MKKALALVLALIMTMSLAACSSGSGGASAGAADVAWAKNVEIQVPAAAGGGTDVMARTLATNVAQQSGSNLTVVNNTDGGGVVAFETTRNAKTDGSTIMHFHTTMLIKTASGLYDKYAAEDFTVIGVAQQVEKGGYVLVVSGDSEFKTLDDVIAKAKASPGELLLGVETGGSSHVMAGLFAKAAGIDFKYVEAGPDTEKLTALVGGSIHMALVNPNQAKQYVESGKAVALAVVSSDADGSRGSVLPDVPSFIEQGVDFYFGTYLFLLGPKGMSEELARKIYDYYAAAALDDEVNKVLGPAGFQQAFLPFEDGPATIRAQQEVLDAVVEELGLKK